MKEYNLPYTPETEEENLIKRIESRLVLMLRYLKFVESHKENWKFNANICPFLWPSPESHKENWKCKNPQILFVNDKVWKNLIKRIERWWCETGYIEKLLMNLIKRIERGKMAGGGHFTGRPESHKENWKINASMSYVSNIAPNLIKRIESEK